MTRYPRTILISILIIFFSSFLLYPKSLNEISANREEIIDQDTKNLRAISLKILQEKLLDHDKSKTFPDELLTLSGLKTIIGYIVDNTNNDIIIFGRLDRRQPAMYIEDIVIALRNAWLKYAVLKSNTIAYSFPGCSIDPNPETIKRLQLIAQKIMASSSFERIEQELKAWKRICNEKQNVRVMGIPFDTRFARIMVEADYDMKCIVDGTDELNIPGLTSLADMKLEIIRQAIVNNRQITISPVSMDRFWFYPGANIYEEDQGIVLIKECPVTLLTEEMYVRAGGRYTPGHRADSLAKIFAESFSILYDAVEYERPIYRELENLFRLVALAKIIKFKSAHLEAGLDIDYLLERFQVSEEPVDKTLPGRSAVKEFEHCQDSGMGSRTAKLWMPSCGGVSVNIQPEPTNFVKNSTGMLSNLKARILNSRPAKTDLSWEVPETKEGLLSDNETSARIFDINNRNENFSTLSIKLDKDGAYQVFSGTNDPIYSSHKAIDIFRTVKARMNGTDLKKIVHFHLDKLPNIDKREAFKTTISMQAKRFEDVRLEVIDCDSRLIAKLTSAGEIKIDKIANSITYSTQGRFKNWYTFSFNFLSKVAGKIYQITLFVYAKTYELAHAFLQHLKSYVSPQNFKPIYLPDKVNEIFNEMKKTHNLKKGDIRIKVKDELDEIEIGKIIPRLEWRYV